MMVVVAIIALSSGARIGYEREKLRFSMWRMKRNVAWANLCEVVRRTYPETAYAFGDDFYFALSFAIDSDVLSKHGFYVPKSGLPLKNGADQILKSTFGDVR